MKLPLVTQGEEKCFQKCHQMSNICKQKVMIFRELGVIKIVENNNNSNYSNINDFNVQILIFDYKSSRNKYFAKIKITLKSWLQRLNHDCYVSFINTLLLMKILFCRSTFLNYWLLVNVVLYFYQSNDKKYCLC